MSSIDTEDFRVELLDRHHDRESFSCGTEALDLYLQRRARQDAERGLSAVHIFTPDGKRVMAFYTLSAVSMTAEDFPSRLSAKWPRHPLPATLLGRMAVDVGFQGCGLGATVLLHALRTAAHHSKTIGSMAVLVDAKDGVADFYTRYGFTPFERDPRRMFLMIDDIRKLYGASSK